MGEESITDITYLVSSLLEKVQHLESKLQLLEKENGFLRYKLHQAELENSRLRERLSHDENPKKDSHNSHIPPSQQPLSSRNIRRTKSLREKSEKSSGGQIGHPGVSLEFTRDASRIENYIPAYCPECGKDLSETDSVILEERWSIDIPPVVPETILHRLHIKQCNCGCVVKAQAPCLGQKFFFLREQSKGFGQLSEYGTPYSVQTFM